MFDPEQGLPDPFALDRAIAATAKRARRYRRSLREGGGLEADPYEMDRWASQRKTFRALAELPASDPLAEPLRRWVYRLVEERVNQPATLALVVRYRHATPSLGGPANDPVTASAVLREALADGARRPAWLEVFARHADELGPIAWRLWERRGEIPERLEITDAAADAIELPGEDVERRALDFLASTDDIYGEVRAEGLSGFIESALGTDAAEGWPAQIHSMTLSDWFRGGALFDRLDLDPGSWPAPLGASSYVRALRRLGAAWVDATAPRRQPFVVANDPYGLKRRTMGALLGLLPVTTPFAERALGLAKRRTHDHQRVMRRVLVIDARVSALRVLLGRAARRGAPSLMDAFEERTEKSLGFALERRYAGVLPRLHVDDAQRFYGLLLAAKEHAALVNRHDEDWYRNPRAAEELRDRADLSPETRAGDEAMNDAVAAFVRFATSN